LTKENHEISNPFQSAYKLLDELDSTRVKILLIETVERSFVERLENFSVLNTKYTIFRELPKKDKQEWSLANTKNIVAIKLGLEDNPIKHFQLTQPMFTGKGEKDLYFYPSDLNLFSIKESKYSILLHNFNAIIKKAEDKGIRLYFLICPDKYDIYQKYIAGNPYQPKTINEDFKRLTSNSHRIIFAKDIIQPLVDKGEKDMYYGGDTHWSWKSAKLVAEEIYNRIN